MVDAFRQAIDGYFAEFDEADRLVIAREIARHRSLAPLLARLGVEDPGPTDAQYAALLMHLRAEGTACLRAGWGAKVETRPEPPAPAGKAKPTPLQRVRVALPGSERTSRSGSPTSPAPKPLPLDARESRRPNDPAKLAPQADRDAGAHLADWDGAERRSPEDRRRNADRRRDCEVVFKNRRYGRDRRSGEERRSNWPPRKP